MTREESGISLSQLSLAKLDRLAWALHIDTPIEKRIDFYADILAPYPEYASWTAQNGRLAELAGVTSECVRKWRKGEAKNIERAGYLFHLCFNRFGLDAEEMLKAFCASIRHDLTADI